MSNKINTSEDFWRLVDGKLSNGCWEWIGCILHSGYGQTRMNYKKYRVHRLAYELTYGPILKGLLVLHKCDNKKCCNPKHLFLGTQTDNIKDRNNKERQARGERNGQHKLTGKDVEEIRLKYLYTNTTQQILAEEYDISNQNISNIINNKTWKFIKKEV